MRDTVKKKEEKKEEKKAQHCHLMHDGRAVTFFTAQNSTRLLASKDFHGRFRISFYIKANIEALSLSREARVKVDCKFNPPLNLLRSPGL